MHKHIFLNIGRQIFVEFDRLTPQYMTLQIMKVFLLKHSKNSKI